jgi:hypothetical protein
MSGSMCTNCRARRDVISGKGSRFLLCLKSADDRRFPKYPPQPVVRCAGYEPDESVPPTQLRADQKTP